jgi:hypothetical protein
MAATQIRPLPDSSQNFGARKMLANLGEARARPNSYEQSGRNGSSWLWNKNEMSWPNAIYRQFLKAALPGMASQGQGDDRDHGGTACLVQHQRFPDRRLRR